MNLQGKKVTVHDMTLRDGMHPKRHQMTLDQMVAIATGLDAAGVPLIEVTHGDGLGGSSVNYGFPAHTDEEYLGAVIPRMKQAKVSALLLPGIGTVDHLKMARELGVPLEVCDHFVLTERIVNNAYDATQNRIELLYKDGSLRDIAEASDTLGIQALARPVEKWYLAYPRWMAAGMSVGAPGTRGAPAKGWRPMNRSWKIKTARPNASWSRVRSTSASETPCSSGGV